MVSIIKGDGTALIELSSGGLIAIVAVSWLIAIALYVLMGFGIRKMGLNRNLKYTKFAFVPVVRWMLVGELVGDKKIFGLKYERFGLIVGIIGALAFLTALGVECGQNLPLIINASNGKHVVICYVEDSMYEGYFKVMSGDYHVYSQFGIDLINGFKITALVLNVIFVIAFINLIVGLFRCYSPRYLLLFTIICGLFAFNAISSNVCGFYIAGVSYLANIFGIFVFCLRNKPMVDYKQYVINMFGGPQNRYGADGNPFNNSKPVDDPFEEKTDKADKTDGDPFDDF